MCFTLMSEEWTSTSFAGKSEVQEKKVQIIDKTTRKYCGSNQKPIYYQHSVPVMANWGPIGRPQGRHDHKSILFSICLSN